MYVVSKRDRIEVDELFLGLLGGWPMVSKGLDVR